jgi:hypothetical protein
VLRRNDLRRGGSGGRRPNVHGVTAAAGTQVGDEPGGGDDDRHPSPYGAARHMPGGVGGTAGGAGLGSVDPAGGRTGRRHCAWFSQSRDGF